jgi:hypothetical protein
MLAERELVPFFPTEGREASVPTTPSSPQLPAAQKRGRRLRKNGEAGAGVQLSSSGELHLPPPQKAKKPSQPTPGRSGKKATGTASPQSSPDATPSTPTKPAFAGAAFEQSPHPSSLPKPRFAGQGSPTQGSPTQASPTGFGNELIDASRTLRGLLGVPLELPATARPVQAPMSGHSLKDVPALLPASTQYEATRQLRSMLGVAC